MSYPKFYNGSRVRLDGGDEYRVIGVSVDGDAADYNLGTLGEDTETWTSHHWDVAEDRLEAVDEEQLSRGPAGPETHPGAVVSEVSTMR